MRALRWVRTAAGATAFTCFYLAELIHSGLQVAVDVVTPRLRARPALIRVPSLARTDTELMVVCNLISLTPGTLVVDVLEGSVLLVHAMFAEDPQRVAAELHRLEQRVLQVLRGGTTHAEGAT